MAPSGFRLPAEWEPQAGVLLAWPHAGTDWVGRLIEVEGTYVALVSAITRFEPALVCVSDTVVRARAELLLRAADVDLGRVYFIEIDYDDTWLRDSGPITLRDGDHFRLSDFRFTGWGGKFEASRDDRMVEQLIARGLFPSAEHRRITWVLEGGAIESDGCGTILTTWRCLHARYPDLSREEITDRLKIGLSASRVLWLDSGHLEGDDTDAHIDTLARFAPGDGIVFQACHDSSDSHFVELQQMAEEIAALRTVDGKPYTLHPLPWPRPIQDAGPVGAGRRLAASYANYLIVNNAVLVPAYDDPADTLAQQVIATAHPGRSVISVRCQPLIWQNGSLHCVTMQLPQGVFA